jgi:Transposase zinc-binding domain
VSRPKLEIADILRDHGAAWRSANAGHVSLDQLKVMSAIERCRTAALGGHVERCEKCSHTIIAYNSCRDRHCPKCQSVAAREWLAEREAELLPVPYYHVVFTLPARIADIAYQNKAVIYDLLFKASSETMLTIAADPKHLGARIGILSVLHSWGSAMTHHPHVALSRPLHPPGRHLKPPLDRMRPERRHLQVEGLQARRSRALSGDDACRPRVLAFSCTYCPQAFHRIRYYGLLASGNRAENVARARELLMPSIIPVDAIKAIGPVLLRC